MVSLNRPRERAVVQLRTLDYENPLRREQWLRGRASDSRQRVRIMCCGVKILGKFFHSTLLQFTQLYT